MNKGKELYLQSLIGKLEINLLQQHLLEQLFKVAFTNIYSREKKLIQFDLEKI